MGDSSKTNNNLINAHSDRFLLEQRRKKTHKDIFIKVRSEQSKTIQMNAMLFFVIILLIIGIYSLVYANTKLDFDDIEFRVKPRIRSFGIFSNDIIDYDVSEYYNLDETGIKNGYESP